MTIVWNGDTFLDKTNCEYFFSKSFPVFGYFFFVPVLHYLTFLSLFLLLSLLNIVVVIYKCQFLGAISGRADCSLCGTRDPKYDCAWCHNACSHRDQCREKPSTSCPPPRIDYIHPISGPIEGGTLVTIEGSNLGSSLDEIRDRVSIGGIRCIPMEYNVSLRVICRTGLSLVGEQSALVVIGNRAGVTRAQAKFQYKVSFALFVFSIFGLIFG